MINKKNEIMIPLHRFHTVLFSVVLSCKCQIGVDLRCERARVFSWANTWLQYYRNRREWSLDWPWCYVSLSAQDRLKYLCYAAIDVVFVLSYLSMAKHVFFPLYITSNGLCCFYFLSVLSSFFVLCLQQKQSNICTHQSFVYG